MTSIADKMETALRTFTRAHRAGAKKSSQRVVVPGLIRALSAHGFRPVPEYRIEGPISLGRIPALLDVPTKICAYVKIDIAVYGTDGTLHGFVESEADLTWVRPNGFPMPGSTGALTYTMSSIARDRNGAPFASYAPLERIAFAFNWKGDAVTTARYLATVHSDCERDHNPAGLAAFLVCEKPSPQAAITADRLRSLGVRYIECGQ